MKIAMMTNNYKPFVSGVAISVERLSESLRKLGHEVVIFAPSYEGCEEGEDEVRCRSLLQGIYCGASIPDRFDRKIEKRFREEAFDVIHVHHPMMIGKTARYLSKKYQIPLVYTYHTRYEQYLHYIGLSSFKALVPHYIRSFTNHCDEVIAPTPMMRECLSRMEIDVPVTVLPTGIPEEHFSPDQEKADELRQRLKREKRYLFCTVSRLAKEKNISFLLKCMAIRKQNRGSDFRLVLLGEGPDESRLRQQAAQLGIAEEVVFEGRVANEEVKNYCAASDLFLFASTSETQGIVLLEAMAAATPVLAVAASGTLDIVSDGINGFLTPEILEDFESRLSQMLDDGGKKRYGQGAYRTALAYAEEEVAKRAVNIYRQTCANREAGMERNVVYFRKARGI